MYRDIAKAVLGLMVCAVFAYYAISAILGI